MRAMILLVDDDPTIRRTIALILGGEHEVLEAAGGRAALEAIARRPPDLLILDMSMPGMGGMEVFVEVRRSWPSLPVVMLTADDDIADAAKALALGARTYITKPFDLRVLVSEVAAAIAVKPAPPESDGKPWRIVP